MKLRKPCIHTLYDGHVIDQWPRAGSKWCDGGVFLPEDTLVIENYDESTIRHVIEWLQSKGVAPTWVIDSVREAE